MLDVCPLRPPRPLPLIADILQAGFDKGAGEYLIYTNIDIGLQPSFYDGVDKLVREHEVSNGAAFCINRRTISDEVTDPARINEMYSQTGEAHPGYDCFVFPREWVSRMVLGDCCVGSLWFPGLLLANMDVLGDGVGILKEEYLTFHLGNDKNWVGLVDYEKHNLRETRRALDALRKTSFDTSNLFFDAFAERVDRTENLSYRILLELKRYPLIVALGRWIRQR